ncbi:MAG: penicillin-binding protein 2 [Alphaproteobacteria bacterium]|nr:penicillin-binding protein 2 [Alphaproteobacteria bacterium]
MKPRDRDRTKILNRRAALLAGGKLVLMGALVGRLYYLQVVQADRYMTLAEDNRINLRLLPPPRGRILDRTGVLLASNRLNYRVVLVSEQTQSVEATLDRLGKLIPISEQEYRKVLRESRRKPGFVPVTVRENLSWAEVARVEVNAPDLPGVIIDVGQSRHYGLGVIAAHITGYVAPVSEDDLTGEPLLELPDFRIGRSGIEKTYDLALRGSAGNSQVEVNAYGRVIRELARQDGEPGDDLALTIDIRLQSYATERIADESAAVAVLDIHNGDVLALASTPSFDPNAFNEGMTQAAWQALLHNPRKPLSNKAIAGQYPPGSTFKMVVALAALENGVVGPNHKVFCTGEVKLGDRVFHCWKRHGHGERQMIDAIEQSCDVYFYDVARRVGIDRIAAMARRLGLGAATGIDLPGEADGLVPDRAWKLAYVGTPWQKGETLIVGIGQGFLLATPLQLAIMVARIANGGVAVTPRLLRRRGKPTAAAVDVAAPRYESIGLSPASLAVVTEGMERVTNSPRGTAYRARITEPKMAMAGKTGTSQVRNIAKSERLSGVRKNEEKPWIERDHALFLAYAPVHEPRYAVAVVVEHGGSGSRAAAPIARDVLRETQRRDPARIDVPGPLVEGAQALDDV